MYIYIIFKRAVLKYWFILLLSFYLIRFGLSRSIKELRKNHTYNWLVYLVNYSVS